MCKKLALAVIAFICTVYATASQFEPQGSPNIDSFDVKLDPATSEPFFSTAGSTQSDTLGANGRILALTVYDGKLIASGEFTEIGGVAANYIAAFDLTDQGWSAAWSPMGSGMSHRVRALTVFGGDLIAGGDFTEAGGAQASKVARWNGSTWSPIGSGLYNSVEALAVCTDYLVAGWSAGPVVAVMRWNGTTWEDFTSDEHTGGSTHAMTMWPYTSNFLVIGGTGFEEVGTDSLYWLYKWDGVQWIPLYVNLEFGKPFTEVYALAVFNSDLIIGGYFTKANGTTVNFIMKHYGSINQYYEPLGSGMNNGVRALTAYDNKLIAGGDFTTAGGTTANGVAAWNGSSWSALGSGVNGPVWAVVEWFSGLIVGGEFTEAGGAPVNNIVAWNGSGWDRDLDGVADGDDNCPLIFNPGQWDLEGDGVGNDCDNCLVMPNPEQEDADSNGVGDACECDEGQQVAWERTYGPLFQESPSLEYLSAIATCIGEEDDGGYFVAGTLEFSNGLTTWRDIYDLELDSCGIVELIGLTGSPYDISIWGMERGYYDMPWVVVGRRDYYNAAVAVWPAPGGSHYGVRSYPAGEGTWGYSIKKTADGGYIIGATIKQSELDWDYYLIKTNYWGITEWTRSYGSENEEGKDWVHARQVSDDQGFIIVGSVKSGPDDYDAYIVRTDSSGETLWTRTYGGDGHESPRFLTETVNNGFIIGGSTNSIGSGGYDFYLMKLSSTGDSLWTKTYGGTGDDIAYDGGPTADLGYVIFGMTQSPELAADAQDLYMIRTDFYFNPVWTTTYDRTHEESALSGLQTTDGGYIAAGNTGSTPDSFLIVKIAPDSLISCCNHDGMRGDADGNCSLNIGDSVYLVQYIFFGGTAPPCEEEGDADGDGSINVGDAVWLVDYIFYSGPPPAPCP